MKNAYFKFMNGRYGQQGMDSFGWFLLVTGLILSGTPFLWVVSPVLGGWQCYRLLSKNTAVRFRENQDFRELVGKGTRWLSPVLLPLKRFAGKAALQLAGWGFQGFVKGRKTLADGKRFLSQNQKRFQERKTSLFVRCPQCRNLLRLPRGKGRLEATCPVCRKSFLQQT